MRGKIFLIMIGCICINVTGCGSVANQKVEVEPNHVTAKTSVETTEISTEEVAMAAEISQPEAMEPLVDTTETIPSIPFAEENGIQFVDASELSGFYGDYNLDFTNEYGDVEDRPGLTKDLGQAFYSLGDIVSEPYEGHPGYVIVTIPYEIVINPTFVMDTTQASEVGYLGFLSKAFSMADYYTGRVFPSRITTNSESYDYYQDIKWDDEWYSVGYSYSRTDNNSWNEWTAIDNQNYKTDYLSVIDSTITVTMPEDYDGLMLFIYKYGYPEPSNYNFSSELDDMPYHLPDGTVETANGVAFEDTSSLDDFYFVRVYP